MAVLTVVSDLRAVGSISALKTYGDKSGEAGTFTTHKDEGGGR